MGIDRRIAVLSAHDGRATQGCLLRNQSNGRLLSWWGQLGGELELESSWHRIRVHGRGSGPIEIARVTFSNRQVEAKILPDFPSWFWTGINAVYPILRAPDE